MDVGQQQVTIRRVSIWIGLVSMVASLCVIVFHTRWRRARRHFDDPILWLSVSCLFAPLSNMGIGRSNSSLCAFEAMGNQFFYLSSFIWVSCIAHQLYKAVVRSESIRDDQSFPMYHLLGWGIPSLSISILLIADQFEMQPPESSDWCWLRPGPWRLILFYIPLLFLILGNLTVYVFIIRTVYRRYSAISFRTSNPGTLALVIQTLAWGLNASLYVIVFVLSRIGSLVNRFQELVNPGNPVFELRMLHAVTQASQGLLYASVYVIHEGVLPRAKAWLDGSGEPETSAELSAIRDYPYDPSGDPYASVSVQRDASGPREDLLGTTLDSEDEYSD